MCAKQKRQKNDEGENVVIFSMKDFDLFSPSNLCRMLYFVQKQVNKTKYKGYKKKTSTAEKMLKKRRLG